MPTTSGEVTKILPDHYQRTYELTYKLWKQRNTTFLFLPAVIGLATLLTFGPAQTSPRLIACIARVLGITENDRITELQRSFPFAMLRGLLLTVVYYLTVNLYHRALYVLRNYRYLGKLENEIREQSTLPVDSVSFARESTFYWNDRAPLLGTVKWIYILFLGALLFALLRGRTYHNFRSATPSLGLLDLAISVPTIAFFISYAYSSVSLDTAEKVLHGSRRERVWWSEQGSVVQSARGDWRPAQVLN
jgi:hypothetical protein